MDVTTIFRTLLQQAQFVSLWRSITWPPEVANVLGYISYINFNPLYVLNIDNLPVVDFRVLFVGVSVLLPITVVVLALLLYSTTLLTVVYLTAVAGITLIIAFVIGAILQSPQSVGIVIAGGALLLTAAVCEIFRRFYRSADGTKEKTEEWHLRFHRRRAFRQFCVAFVFLIVGLVFLQVIPLGISFDGIGVVVTTVIGAVCVGLGALFALYFLANLTPIGRRIVRTMALGIEYYGSTLLFSLTTLVFIPCCNYCVTVFMCRTYSCGSGEAFNPFAKRPNSVYSGDESLLCNPCIPLNRACAGRSPSDLCRAESFYHNILYPDIPCGDAGAVYYYVASGIVLCSFVIGTPALLYIVISNVTESVKSRMRVPEGEDDEWGHKVSCEETASAALYSHFSYNSRYFYLIQLGLNISVTLITVIVSPFSALGATVAVGAVYMVFLITVIVARPYRHRLEFVLMLYLSCINVVNAALAIVATTKVEVGLWLPIVFFVANGSSVLVAIVVLIIDRCNVSKRQEQYQSTSDPYMMAENKEIRLSIDRDIAAIFSKGLMIMGVFLFLALASCIVVLQLDLPRRFRISTKPAQQTLYFQTAGYPTWDSMTASCCCFNNKVPAADFAVEEQWLCNGTSLYRGRASSNGQNNATLLRDVCATTPRFPDRCTMEVINDRLRMRCLSDFVAAIVPRNVSQIAYEFFF